MKMRTLCAGALVGALFVGCNLIDMNEGGGGGGEIAFRTGAVAYAIGQEIDLHLENHTGQALGYNLCLVELQRERLGAWTPVKESEGRVCTMELRLLEAGEASTQVMMLDGLHPGERYRLETTVEYMGSGARQKISSNAFRITS